MMYEEAIQASHKAVELQPSFPIKLLLAYAYAVTGKTAQAKEILEEMLELSQQQYVSAYAVARVYAALDEKERAFEWLNKACQQQSSELAILKVDPRLDKLRPDSRFTELLKKVRLEK